MEARGKLGGRPRLTRRPRNRLTQWMSATDTSTNCLAAAVGVSISSIYSLREQTFRPSLVLALKLERETGIPVTYWASFKLKKRPKREA